MADLGHLEKMGRELKCPICLSLLNSAVSLACNHVFCNSCISESLKVASDCPVCKAPYRRREVRPAPHMDNLVSICKSMEVAAGIYVTQTAPLIKSSDEPTHDVDDKNSCIPEAEETCQRKLKKRALKIKPTDGKGKADNRNSSSHPLMPSFPAKKRVHVTPYPVSETPLRAEKLPKSGDPSTDHKVDRELETNVGDKNKDISTVSKENISVDEKGGPMFSPSFCLREAENDVSDKPSAHQTADMLLPDAPCFSDMKDSDDESPIKMTPTSKPYTTEDFDSEMFEWTQRACSPELCSTPMRKQTVDKHRLYTIQEKGCELASQNGLPDGNGMLLSKGVKGRRANQVNEIAENYRTANARKRTTKRKKGANKKIQSNKVEMSADINNITGLDEAFPEGVTESTETAENSCPVNVSTENNKTPRPGTKCSKIDTNPTKCFRRKHVKKQMNQFDHHDTAEALEQLPIESSEAKLDYQETKDACTPFPTFPCQKTIKNEIQDVHNKRGKKTMVQSQRKRMKTSIDDVTVKILEEVPPKACREVHHQNAENRDMEMTLPELSCQRFENDKGLSSGNGSSKGHGKVCTRQQKKWMTEPNGQNRLADRTNDIITANDRESDKALGSGNGSKKKDEKISTQLQKKQLREPEGQKKVTDQTNEMETAKDGEEMPPASMSSVEYSSEITFKPQQKPKSDATKNTPKTLEFLHAPGDHILRKCENIPSHTRCVFCQSSNETEVSGEMMHYFNGKPVAADYNGGINVIHSHKHCTEWAPNVYFQDDSAINLAVELARSKRIKCSCCGIKGAALGCFEKTCRKSFHYTCAKLIPQCRWDTENFVMICPLHLLSKLPNEIPVPQRQSGNRSTPKREIQSQGTIKSGTSRLWKWPLGYHCKWVLCCSALSIAEKEIVSEFTKVTGLSVSKAWSPAVTHVIASTDENGACRRTLKFLMGITEGKWILKINWVKACIKAMEPVDEEQYEIKVDVHGMRDGPRLGRLRAINQKPKLFNGFKFYFTGDITASYKGYLQDLVVAAGGTVLQRKPISRDKEKLLDESPTPPTFIIYSLLKLDRKCDFDRNAVVFNCRRVEAQALADVSGAKAAENTWILDSIAGCKLQSLNKQRFS